MGWLIILVMLCVMAIQLHTQEEVGGANITASCQQSRTSSVVSATMATNSYKITELLPGCHYEFNVGVASCSVDTPPGPGKWI